MRLFYLPLLFLLLAPAFVGAQAISINTDASSPDPSAILDVKSSNKGMLVPRMTTTQRTAIATPATGLLVFDTNTNSFWFFNGTAWTNLAGSGGGAPATFIADTDGNTKVQTEASPNEDIIRFNLGGTENMVLRKNTSGIPRLELTQMLNNIYVGRNAGQATTTGSGNTAHGAFALNNNTAGGINTALGYSSLTSNTTGNNNTAIGASALFNNISGTFNTANGESALFSNTLGSQNTAHGLGALITNTTGSGNTALGFQADVSAAGLGNATAIGFKAKVGASNSLVLGATGADAVNVGIGTTTPQQKLDVRGNGTDDGAVMILGNADLSHKIMLFPGRQNDPQPFLLWKHGDPLRFVTDAGGFSEKMRLTSDGKMGIGTTAPDASALLDLTATDKGILVPRMTTAQRTAIAAPATGLLVFDTTTGGFWFYNGAAWTNLSGGGAPATFIADTDGNTKVQTEKTPNEDIVRFDLAGTESMVLRKNAGGSPRLELPNALNNTFLGTNAGSANTTGSNNTANGLQALFSNTTGSNNTANGWKALFSNTTGRYNTASGRDALVFNTTGNSNTALGIGSLRSNTDRSNLVAVGDSALYNNGTGATLEEHATANTALGSKALLANTTGYYNTANGFRALFSNTTGSYNTANGVAALYSNTTGSYSTANGFQALHSNTTGNYNTANGLEALGSNTTGSDNTANGFQALGSNTTGNSNTANGLQALFSNTTGNNNTALGFGADVTANNLTNATAIGYNAKAGASNSVVLGGTGADAVNVGIGTATPAASAILDMQATNKGMLLPRMTTAQRDAISNPVPGLMIYNTTDSCFNYYAGNAWYKDCGRNLNADTVTWPPTQGGGSGSCNGAGITADASGNVMVTGYFYGTATFGSTTLTSSGDRDVFTVKYDAGGTVLWAKQGGGSGDDQGLGITADASGNVMVTGYFTGTATFGSTTLTNSGIVDVFTVKYNASGTVLWAKQGGGSGPDYGIGITTDASGNVMVTGEFRSTATFGSTTLTSSGFRDVFTVKYDAGGTVLWAKQGGGSSDDSGSGITADASGNVMVTGDFSGTATFGSITLTSSGFANVFTVKYDASGTVLWAKQGGGQESGGITADASGNVMITGDFTGTATFGSTTLTSIVSYDVFTVKYDADGTVLWAKQGGGGNFDSGYGITADASGNVMVTGYFTGTATFGSATLTGSGSADVFTVKYDASGTVLWAKQGGGSDFDYGSGVTADASGNVMVTGAFKGTATFGSTTLTSSGINDVFVVKYSSTGSQAIPTTNLSATQENDPQVGANTINYLPKWNGTALVNSSSVFENGNGNVGIGKTSPEVRLHAFAADPSATNGIVAYFQRAGAGDVGISFSQEGVNAYGITHPVGGGLEFHRDRWPGGAGTLQMKITDSGNVGIGTPTPAATLDVKSANPSIVVGTAGGGEGALYFGNTNHGIKRNYINGNDVALFTTAGDIILESVGTGIAFFVLANNGNVGIGRFSVTNKLEVEGQASKTTPGSWVGNSDARLKKNITPLDSHETLDKLLALQGVTYEWNDDKTGSARPEGIQYGFTAQNIQTVFPTLVEEDKLGYLQTAYGTYDAMTVEAIRALNDKITTLEAENAGQKAENAAQKAENAVMKAQLDKITAALQTAGIGLENR